MNRTMLAAVTLALFAAAARADDAETRFHHAYEQEVVDGKVADAAREYLAMMGDEKVPERLRAEARFRFAVTATLLGRADEARANFAELVRDPKTPETLRARAAEYLDAAKGIGVGSEMDRKLEALVFDLGRLPATGSDVPATYRDFEIIGKPAVPLLKRLLQHSDLALRQHAYQILLRLREPGMAALWTREIGATYGALRDLGPYARADPAEGVQLEKRLVAADSGVLGRLTYGVRLSSEFLRAAAKRNISADVIVPRAVGSLPDAAFERLLVEWMESDDPALSSAAALGLARAGSYAHLKDWRPGPAIFTRVADRLCGTDTDWTRDSGVDTYRGFLRLASLHDVAMLLDTLDATVGRIGSSADDVGAVRAAAVTEAVASAVDEKSPSGADAVRYAAALRKWAAQPRARAKPDFNAAMSAHIGRALRDLPAADAESLAAWAVTDVFRGNAEFAAGTILPADAAGVPVMLAGFRAADGSTRSAILKFTGLTGSSAAPKSPTPEFAHAMLAALPDLTRWSAESGTALPFATFAQLALLVPAGEARDRFTAALAAGSAARDRGVRENGLGWILATSRVGEGVDAVRYHARVVVPSLDAAFQAVHADDRQRVVLHAFALLDGSGGDADVQRTIRDFLLAHVDLLPNDAGMNLAGRTAMFPLTSWVPRAPASIWRGMNVPGVAQDAADAAVREMTRDPAAVNESVLAFTIARASVPLQVETLDRLLRTAPVERLRTIVFLLPNVNGSPASPDALEDALGRVVAAEKPDLSVVATLSAAVRFRRPSEKLFPAIRLLLAGDEQQVVAGIDAASSIGREEMLPVLATALDSMNPAVRAKARDAIDSIVALRKLKEEARSKAGDGR